MEKRETFGASKVPRSWKQIANRNLRSVTLPVTIQSDISYFTTIANRHGAINDSKQNRRGRWQLCLIHQRKQDCRLILFLTTDQRRQRTETSTDTSHNSRQKATQTTAKIRSSQIHTNKRSKKLWKSIPGGARYVFFVSTYGYLHVKPVLEFWYLLLTSSDILAPNIFY